MRIRAWCARQCHSIHHRAALSRRARPDLAREAVPHHTPQDTAEQARASGRGARGGTTAHMTARHNQAAVQQRLHHLTIFL